MRIKCFFSILFLIGFEGSGKKKNKKFGSCIIEFYFIDTTRILPRKTCRYFYNGQVHIKPCGDKSSPSKLKYSNPHFTQAAEGYLQPCKTNDRLPGLCRPPAYCFYQYDNPAEYRKNMCDYKTGLRGVCCPTDGYRHIIYKDSKYQNMFHRSITQLYHS